MQAPSLLDLSYNGRAHLVPLACGILYSIICSCGHHACKSHIGTMPIVNTIKTVLKDSVTTKWLPFRTHAHDTTIAITYGCKTTKPILLIFNNLQHFLKQCVLHIGCENSIIIGIPTTYI